MTCFVMKSRIVLFEAEAACWVEMTTLVIFTGLSLMYCTET